MTTTTDHHGHGPAAARLRELREPTIRLRRRIPEAFQAFLDLSNAAMTDGALSAKHKELIALALAVSQHCEGCIAYHARGAARRGATEPEVAEALAVTIVLGGGPAASDYAPRALQAFREFADAD
ncbi:MAG TPA: carboxymuconolactone decarboxylase family protein [Euzebyales bacterium]|nr:carboxymuconolactone decarboxylase family protein [Euzebyales bacterium]